MSSPCADRRGEADRHAGGGSTRPAGPQQPTLAASAVRQLAVGRAAAPAAVRALQQQAGNRAVARLVAAASGAERTLARSSLYDIWKPIRLSKSPASATVRWDAHATWDGPSLDPWPNRAVLSDKGATLVIPAGSKGDVKIDVVMRVAGSEQKMSFTWTVTADQQGRLTLKQRKDRTQLEQPTIKTPPLAVRSEDMLVPSESDNGNELSLKVRYSGASETVGTEHEESESITTEGEGKIKVKSVELGGAKVGQTGGKSDTDIKSSTHGEITSLETFHVKVFPVGGKPPPPPTPAPAQTFKRTWYVLFEEGQSRLPVSEGAWLHKWWDSLHPQTRDALQKTDKALVVKGYASTTGPSTDTRKPGDKRPAIDNVTLAAQRIASVLEVLNQAAGTQGGRSLIKKDAETHAYGEYKDVNATDDKPFETPAKYAKRVEISVEDVMRSDPDDTYSQVELMRLGREIRLRQEQVELKEKKSAAPDRPNP